MADQHHSPILNQNQDFQGVARSPSSSIMEQSQYNQGTTTTMEFSTISKSLNYNMPIKLSRSNYLYWKTLVLPSIQALDLENYICGINRPHNMFEDVEVVNQLDGEHLKGKKIDEMINASLISSFQAFPMQLALKDRYIASQKKCSDLQKANDTLKQERDSIVKDKQMVEEKAHVLDEELTKSKDVIVDRDRKLMDANAIIAERDRQIVELNELLTSISLKAMCAARVDLFKQYLAGEHTKWNPHAEIAGWEEVERFDA
ncbi:hypothetical protein Dsin_001458 [Dipteronia sinensis]|uniref:Uncharacterized protein n=1 Tax=Dipteronia sinensis TaxID=43782 RepID=A0AAE0B4B9_9ROSI|nr:hypothetical protein Dsin_001458 [Dipteronia sinensis]